MTVRLAAVYAVLTLTSAVPMADQARGQVMDLAPAPGLAGRFGGMAVTDVGSGPAIVIVPGLLGATFGFRKVIGELAAAGHRVIVVEPLGTGSSDRPEGADYSLTAQADRIGAVLDTLGVREAVVVGHALGGAMVYRLAYRRPELVRAVVSINGPPAERAGTPGLGFALRFAPVMKIFGGADRARRKIRDGLVESSADPAWVTDEVLDGYTVPFAADLSGTMRALRAMGSAREPEPLEPNLPRIGAPVCLLYGAAPEGGALKTEEIERLGRLIPRFGAVRVEGAGQYIQEERPEEVVAAVRSLATLATADGDEGPEPACACAHACGSG
ncbi:MAG TPA: alpha/beta hydrolase [Longimicrobiales bacterium]|nr:alpha/beta hydrolase [Longimicrobiales bacterium]